MFSFIVKTIVVIINVSLALVSLDITLNSHDEYIKSKKFGEPKSLTEDKKGEYRYMMFFMCVFALNSAYFIEFLK